MTLISTRRRFILHRSLDNPMRYVCYTLVVANGMVIAYLGSVDHSKQIQSYLCYTRQIPFDVDFSRTSGI